MTPDQIARKLSPAQRSLVLESKPGGWGRDDTAIGVPIRGSQYRTAGVLQRLGVGDYTHGSPFGDLYFNDDLGLQVRALLTEEDNAE